MKVNGSPLIGACVVGLLPFVLSATVTEAPVKTITEYHTVTYTPTETQAPPDQNTVTKTLHETVQPNPPIPAVITSDGTSDVNENSTEEPVEETAEVGYDASYFLEHLENNNNNNENDDDDDDDTPELDGQFQFNQLNAEFGYNDQEENELDIEDENEEYYEFNEIEDENPDLQQQSSSPYHLEPDYRGTTNPKESLLISCL